MAVGEDRRVDFGVELAAAMQYLLRSCMSYSSSMSSMRKNGNDLRSHLKKGVGQMARGEKKTGGDRATLTNKTGGGALLWWDEVVAHALELLVNGISVRTYTGYTLENRV
jgi:hypothetical protein